MKAAFLAFDQCSFWQIARLLTALSAMGWQMRTLTLGGRPVVCDSGVAIHADASIEAAAPRDYQLVILAGGQIPAAAVEDADLLRFVRQYDGTRNLFVACGSAVAVLGAAGLLGGIRYVADDTVHERYGHLLTTAVCIEEEVCYDANFITTSGYADTRFIETVLHLCHSLKGRYI